jgi:adenylate kinase
MEFYLTDIHEQLLKQRALDAFLVSIKSLFAASALETDDEILVQRLLERGKTSGRIDDQDEEKIRNLPRIQRKTAPLMDYYKNQNKYFAVNGIVLLPKYRTREFSN